MRNTKHPRGQRARPRGQRAQHKRQREVTSLMTGWRKMMLKKRALTW